MLYDFDDRSIIATDYQFIAENHAHVVTDQSRPTLGHCRSKNGC